MDAEALARELLGYSRDVQRAHRNHVPDLSHGEMPALHHLANHPGIGPSDLSRLTCVSTARIASLLNGLEKKGWVTRIPDPNDGRRVVLELTRAGREAVETHYQRAVTEFAGILTGLGEPDASEYVRLTGRVRDLMVGD